MVSVGRPRIAHSHKQIADYAYSLSEKAVAEAHTSLDARMARYSAVYGDIENEAGDIGDAELEVFDNMISTTPTSVHGVRPCCCWRTETAWTITYPRTS